MNDATLVVFQSLKMFHIESELLNCYTPVLFKSLFTQKMGNNYLLLNLIFKYK